MNAPVSLFAAHDFTAVFAGATNTPLACTIMEIELFGSEYVLFFAVASFTFCLFNVHSVILFLHCLPVNEIQCNIFNTIGLLVVLCSYLE